MAKVAIFAVYHETNTFSRRRTDLAAFRAKGWFDGPDLLRAYRGTGTVIGGFIDGLGERGHQPHGIFGAFATPSGPVTIDAFEQIMARIDAGSGSWSDIDGVLVELHGAMVVDGIDDPEGLLCRRLAEKVGPRPIVAAVDLHANMTAERLRHVHQVVGYRTNPHVDTWETGRDAARHLDRLLGGAPRPTVAFAHVPMLMPAVRQSTSKVPLLRVLAAAREQERAHDLLDVTVTAGYAYADVPHAGLGVTVSTNGSAAVAGDAASRVATVAWEHRDELRGPLHDAQAALRLALALPGAGPAVVADTGDNINAGASGDETDLLRAARTDDGARRVLGTYTAPDLARAAQAAGPGGEVPLPHALARAVGAPTARVRECSDGTFSNRGPMAHGASVSMGPAVALEIGALCLVIQSLPVQPNDPAMFESLGVDPGDFDVLLLKGAAALAAGWSSMTRGIVPAATPGLSDSDLSRLPYRRLRRDTWPLGVPAEPVRVQQLSPSRPPVA